MAESSSAILSHWYCLLEGMEHSTKDFYTSLKAAVGSRNIPDIKVTKIYLHEGGALSAKRLYLRIRYKSKRFDICAAPFGNGFFISWWLRETEGCLANIPYIGPILSVINPITYYKMDTTLMFQESIRNSVLEVIDEITKAKGIRSLSQDERKPIMHGMFKN